MQINNLFLYYSKVLLGPNNRHFQFFFPVNDHIYLENGEIIDLETFSKNEHITYNISSFTIDPNGSKLLAFIVSNSDSSKLSAIIFQLNEYGKLQQLNTIPFSSGKSSKETDLYILEVSILDLPSIYNKNLKDIPSGIIQNMYNLLKEFDNKINVKFILSLKNISYLSMVTKLPQADIQILSDLNYHELLEYAKYDLYVKQIINIDEFFFHYISKHFNSKVLEEKPINMTYKEYYEYIMKIISPVLNIEMLNSTIDFSKKINLFSISEDSLSSKKDISSIHEDSLFSKNQLNLFEFITNMSQFHDIYNNYILKLLDDGNFESLMLKVTNTKNIDFIKYFVKITLNQVDYSDYSIISNIIENGDVDFYEIAIAHYNDDKFESQYIAAIMSGNLEMVELIVNKYEINERQILLREIEESLLFQKLTYDVLRYIFDDKVNFDNLNERDIKVIFMNINYKDENILLIIEYLLIKIFGKDHKDNNSEYLKSIILLILESSSLEGNLEVFKHYYDYLRSKKEESFKNFNYTAKYMRWFSNAVSYGHFDIVIYFEKDLKFLPEYVSTNNLYGYHTMRLHMISNQPKNKISTLLLAVAGNNLDLFEYLKNKFVYSTTKQFFNIKDNLSYFTILISFRKTRILDKYINTPDIIQVNLRKDIQNFYDESKEVKDKLFHKNILTKLTENLYHLTRAQYLLIMILQETFYDIYTFQHIINAYDIFYDSNKFLDIYLSFSRLTNMDDITFLIKQEYIRFDQLYISWKNKQLEIRYFDNILSLLNEETNFLKNMFDTTFKNLDYDFLNTINIKYLYFDLTIGEFLKSLLLAVLNEQFIYSKLNSFNVIISNFMRNADDVGIIKFVDSFYEKLPDISLKYRVLTNFKAVMRDIFETKTEYDLHFMDSFLINKAYKTLKMFIMSKSIDKILTQIIIKDNLELLIYMINEFDLEIEEDKLEIVIRNASTRILDYLLFTFNIQFNTFIISDILDLLNSEKKLKLITYLKSKNLM